MDTKALTSKRWVVLIVSCIINVMIGTGYAWSMFAPALAGHFAPDFGGDASKVLPTLTLAFTISNSIGPIPMIIGGWMNDNIGPKWSIFIGGILFGGGMIISSFATSPMMIVFGYGVVLGLGMGFVYGCTIGNSIKFFPDHAGLAGGLATATYGLGSVLLPLIIKNIVNPDTVLPTFRVLGIIYLVVICVGSFLVTRCPVGFVPDGWTPPAPAPGAKAPESKNWKQMLADPIFWVMMILMICGAVFGMMLISNCRGVVSATALASMGEAGVGAAATTVTILALFNALGRVGCGTLSDKIGRVNTLTLMLAIGVIGFLILTRVTDGSLGLFRVGAACVGLAFGAFMGVYPGFCAEQFGPKNNGMNYGIMFIGFALAGYIGPKILLSVGGADFSNVGKAYIVAAVIGVVGICLTFVYRAMNKAK